MAVVVKDRKGKDVTLLNPAEKGRKYSAELKERARFTNDGFIKTDKFDNAIGLTPIQASYRSGYLQARKDSAKCYKSNLAKNQTKKKGK